MNPYASPCYSPPAPKRSWTYAVIVFFLSCFVSYLCSEPVYRMGFSVGADFYLHKQREHVKHILARPATPPIEQDDAQLSR
jgi:hypothetical protein